MKIAKRIMVTFHSDSFNTSVSREYFRTPNNFGDDACNLLISMLLDDGIPCDRKPVEQEWGWIFEFKIDGVGHTLYLAQRDDRDNDWLILLRRVVSQWSYVLGLTDEAVLLKAAQIVHKLLTASSKVSEIRWHRSMDFDAQNEETATKYSE